MDQTKEIVFFDIHRFNPEKERKASDSPGHRRLKQQLHDVFGKHMVSYSNTKYQKTFHECWNEDRRLFVSYNHGSYAKDTYLWPRITVQNNKRVFLYNTF